MEQFLHKLNIYLVGEIKNGQYVADIDDSDEYDKILAKLSKSDELELDEDSSTLTLHSASNIYDSENYEIIVTGDFDNDLYKLTVKEIK